MAKGARKKTKWVSLSLASATSSTVPPAELDAASKSFRGTKQAISEDGSGVNVHSASCPENSDSNVVSTVESSDRRSSWNNNTNGYSRRQMTEGSNGQPHSNGYHSHPPRNYSSHFKSHYNRNSYYHNGSSRKPHYNSYNDGNGSYKNNSNDQYTAGAKNEQNGAVIINEDEYTKITTPRQDVLFKKGYLSRPKKYTTTSSNANENGAATGSSSVNGTTDGSDVATASGSVSTAESVTSDSAYLTDNHLLDYPAPLPYFGYIDQSGVLVMNGFAVDNSGFPYMNGGQTYIYPTNYHCQSSFNEDGQIEEVNVDGVPASDDDENQSNDTFDGVVVAKSVADTLQVDAEACLLKDQARLNSISEENGQDEAIVEDSADLNQQVPQQPMLSPFANSYNYAQFYNGLYYPGCMVAPFPMVGNEMYCDQFGGISEEEHARQQSFRKRKKRYRNWDEYPADFYPDGMIETMYQYPNGFSIPETEVTDSTEVPAPDIMSEPTSSDQAVPTQPSMSADNTDLASHNSTNELPPSQQSHINPASQRSSKLINTQNLAERSQHLSTVSHAQGRQRSQGQKNRKKDLIESTRAFAEQNIDLTRPVSLLRPTDVQQSETSGWRTVRNGKEVTVEDSKNLSKTNLVKDVAEPPSDDKLFYDGCKQEQSAAGCDSTTAVSEDTKRPKKDTTGRKGKKTVKGKGKRSKKLGLSYQQKGFEVIEPEFTVSKISNESELTNSTDAADEVLPSNENSIIEEVDENEQDIVEGQQEEEHASISNENELTNSTLNLENDEDYDVECLEEDFRDIQLSDLQIENVDHMEDQPGEVIDTVDKECEIMNIPDEPTVQTTNQNDQKHVDTPENDELHEVPSELVEGNELASLATTYNQACAEEVDIIENNELTENCNLPFNSTELLSPAKVVDYEHEDEDDQQKCKHFSNEEYFENFDSGVQSPAAFTSSSSDSKERKSSTSSFSSQEIQLTDAVTKWLSETLSNKRLEELFVLPEDPILLHRIHQFNVLNFDESLVLSSDTYSSSSCDEAEDSVDSDYMSDVQAKNRELNGLDGQQKTELKKDQLAKQTANGHRLANGDGDHSNHKQKRCIIM